MVAKRQHRRSINESGHTHELTFGWLGRYPFLSQDRSRRRHVERLVDDSSQ